ncbi:GFA family protein [Phenylobacterium montanum]|uniref:Aldehyde-activating protein n=1 Tax=Phenylobacterium montanum TaxID=2823693 RepID=A0A975G146_9CAUL|nr:aldehyde-activating protein [Caulobacter sp. S6]QUD88864.1 aldehyde-activating protein [Caulobacter sp. S6]
MARFDGACHCGRLKVAFETPSPAALSLRACQCSFCRRHGARNVSDPAGSLAISAEAASLHRYRFGRKGIDMLICGECGTYVAALCEIDGALYATLNITGADIQGLTLGAAEPVDYEEETDAARLARRRAKWTPASLTLAA